MAELRNYQTRAVPNAGSRADASIDMGLRAAQLIGNGLYGVDIKQTEDGFFVIEVNDNPNLDHGCEDSGEKDEVWIRLTQWFLDKLERPGR